MVYHASLLPSEVYESVKMAGGDIQCVIAAISRYYGWNDRAIWDWIEIASRAE